jgi:hypothetical protein
MYIHHPTTKETGKNTSMMEYVGVPLDELNEGSRIGDGEIVF